MLSVAACNGTDAASESSPQHRPADEDAGEGEPADDDPVFVGTAVEHAEAMADCFEGHGWAVTPDPDDPTGFSLDTGLTSREETLEVMEACQEEVGAWTRESLPDGYLEEVYEHRLRQRECLESLGYRLPDPPSFDRFAETLDWSPLDDLSRSLGVQGAEFLTARSECPDLHQAEQQEESNP